MLARSANTAVIIRRGPSKSVCTLLWDRRNDTFKLGQWLRGRIYERRCDLSPDGKHFIYFAMNGKPRSSPTASSAHPNPNLHPENRRPPRSFSSPHLRNNPPATCAPPLA